MNEDSAKRGIEAVEAFIRTFNAQDHERQADTLNYPHIRLANGRFTTIENAEAFIEGSRRGEARLQEEGWHHTVVASLEVVHAGKDKVHIAIRNDRCRADGTVYHSFDTSFLRGASPSRSPAEGSSGSRPSSTATGASSSDPASCTRRRSAMAAFLLQVEITRE